jgi:putative ABC transport system substrate-binding protein
LRQNENIRNKKINNRIISIGAVSIILLLCGCGAKPKVYHVGILYIPGAFTPISDGFKSKMAALGYRDGVNIVYSYTEVPPTATPDEIKLAAKKMVENNVDLIFTYLTPPILGAYEATRGTKIPVVFAMFNVEGSKIIKSVREPGGNITGVRYPSPEIIKQRLEILHEMAPRVKSVWVGYDENHPNTPLGVEAIRSAANTLDIKLLEKPVSTLSELKADLEARAKSATLGFDAIVTLLDGMNQSPDGFALLNKFTTEHNIPLCTGVGSYVKEGALFGNAPDMLTCGELSAFLADKILKGTPAGTIPVLTPEIKLIINYKVSQKLNLKVPESLLLQAKEIIR